MGVELWKMYKGKKFFGRHSLSRLVFLLLLILVLGLNKFVRPVIVYELLPDPLMFRIMVQSDQNV